MLNTQVFDLLERMAMSIDRITAHLLENTPQNSFVAEQFKDLSDNIVNISHCIASADKAATVDAIEQFLATRKISIKKTYVETDSDVVLNSLAEFLGKNYDALREFLKKIKRNMQQGNPIQLSLKNMPQKDVGAICQFAHRLHEVAFLEQYKYFKSPQYLIKAKTTTLPMAQNFFSGQWLERFVLYSAARAVKVASNKLHKALDFSYLLNPQIILPNGDDFELDLIFQVNGVFYWIESKSGDYQNHIKKYAKMSKILGLDLEHSMMVLPDIDSGKAQALSSLFLMRVLPLAELENHLTGQILTEHDLSWAVGA